MGTLNAADQMTPIEIARRANEPNAWRVIEIMGQTNEMLLDVPAYKCNSGIVNVATQRVTKPIGQHRIYNQGVGFVATQTEQTQDRIAMLAAYAQVDASMIGHTGNIQAARHSERVAICSGMGLTQADALVYATKSKKEEFSGLMERLNDLSNPCVINMGGTGNNLTSIYLCAVGQNLFHLIYPEGSKSVGVSYRDDDLVDIIQTDESGKVVSKYKGYQDYFEAQYGISLPNPESVIRICNIPANATGDDIIDKVLECKRKLPKGAPTYAMYSNESVLVKIDKAARDKGNVVYTREDPWGREITHIREIRCRQMDVILDTESQVA
jgi:hypothetical protein